MQEDKEVQRLIFETRLEWENRIEQEISVLVSSDSNINEIINYIFENREKKIYTSIMVDENAFYFYSLETKLRNLTPYLKMSIKLTKEGVYISIIHLGLLENMTKQKRSTLKNRFNEYSQKELTTAYDLYNKSDHSKYVEMSPQDIRRMAFMTIADTEYKYNEANNLNYNKLLSHIHNHQYWQWGKEYNTDYKRELYEETSGYRTIKGNNTFGEYIDLSDVEMETIKVFLHYVHDRYRNVYIKAKVWEAFFTESKKLAVQSAIESFGIIKMNQSPIRGFRSARYELKYNINHTNSTPFIASNKVLHRMQYLTKIRSRYSRTQQIKALKVLDVEIKTLGMFKRYQKYGLSRVYFYQLVNDLEYILSLLNVSQNPRIKNIGGPANRLASAVGYHINKWLNKVEHDEGFKLYKSWVAYTDFDKEKQAEYYKYAKPINTPSKVLDSAYNEYVVCQKEKRGFNDDIDVIGLPGEHIFYEAFEDKSLGHKYHSLSKIEVHKFSSVLGVYYMDLLASYLVENRIYDLNIELVSDIIKNKDEIIEELNKNIKKAS